MFWYLSSPYSKYADGLDGAYKLAAQTRGLLVRAGIPCFSPILHSHPVAVLCAMDPYNNLIWWPAEAPIMAAACGMIELRADGWQQSVGMRYEREAFEEAGKPIIAMDPGHIPLELLQA